MSHLWTPQMWARAQRMSNDRASVYEIAEELNLTVEQVYGRFNYEKVRFKSGKRSAKAFARPSVEMEKSRDARAVALRSVTAFVCGDPPPGFSALDQKQKNGSHPS